MKYLTLLFFIVATVTARAAEEILFPNASSTNVAPVFEPPHEPTAAAPAESAPGPLPAPLEVSPNNLHPAPVTMAPAAVPPAPAPPPKVETPMPTPPTAAPAAAAPDDRVPTAALPADLDELLKRIRTCTSVWENEPTTSRLPRGGDFEKREKFQKALRKNHCNNLSRSLIAMREKYRAQPEVAHICDSLITQPPDQYKALLK